MLQGQEKSCSIVDTNLPFSSFSCCLLPGEGEAEMLLRGAPRRPHPLYSVTAGPNPTPFRAPGNCSRAHGADGQGKVEEQSSHPGTARSVKFQVTPISTSKHDWLSPVGQDKLRSLTLHACFPKSLSIQAQASQERPDHPQGRHVHGLV